MGRPRSKPLGEVLSRVLQACGKHSLKDLAAYLGVSDETVRNWDKRNAVPLRWISHVSIKTGRSQAWLLGKEKDPNPAGTVEPNSGLGLSRKVQAGARTGTQVILDTSAFLDARASLLLSEQVGTPWLGAHDGARDNAIELQKVPLLPIKAQQEVRPLVLSLQMTDTSARVDYEVIPKLVGTVSAGPAIESSKGVLQMDRAGELAMSYGWLTRNLNHTTGDLVSVQVHGDSMSPTLLDGDTIVIDRGIQDVRVDGIYVIVMGGNRLVKRLQKKFDETVVVISDNMAYERETIPRNRVREIEVIGRMVWPRVR